MKTGKTTAIFDCKTYNAKLPKEQWKVKADNENIQATVTYALAELPDMFKQDCEPGGFVRLYAGRTERDTASHENRQPIADRAAVRFKVGANCKWFDKYGKASERPTNAELDGKRFDVNIDFARKDRKPDDPLAPSGYWANAIMYREIEENIFAGEEFEKTDDPEDEPPYIQHFDNDTEAAAAPAAPAAEQSDEEDEGLPF